MIEQAKNEGTVSGKLYDFGRFGLKVNDDGRIMGSVIVATDEDCANLVEVGFIPQSPKTKAGKDNSTYKTLKEIIDGEKIVTKVGVKEAISVRISVNLEDNLYYTEDNNSELILHETPRLRGGFIHIDDRAKPYCGLNVDVFIDDIEDTFDQNDQPKGIRVKGKVFNSYRKYFMSVNFEIEDPDGIAYIKGSYMPKETYATLSCTVEDKTIQPSNEVSGFGVKAVASQPKKINRLVIIGAETPKDFPMTDEDIDECRQNKEVVLSEAKNRFLTRKKDKQATVGFGKAPTSTTFVNTNSQSAKKYDF